MTTALTALVIVFVFVTIVCCRHAPLYDGTAKTMPKNLKNDTIMDKIEKANEDHMSVKDKKHLHIFEGDIELTPDTKKFVETTQTEHSENAKVDVSEITSKKTAVRSRQFIWPSRTIPIQLTPELGTIGGQNSMNFQRFGSEQLYQTVNRFEFCSEGQETQKNENYTGAPTKFTHARKNVIAALSEIMSKTCIRFRDKIPSDKRWIKMVKKHGCWSPVGRQVHQKGGQELSIGDGCNYKGTIIHEVMHALGFWHEQSRTDRDGYVNILWENVDKGQQHNFNKYDAAQMDMVGGMYDFDSVMHYGNFAFSSNKKPTMLSIKNPVLVFGRRRSTLSKTDIIQLNSLYDCKTKSGGWSSWTNWGPCNLGCLKKRERFCTDKLRLNCPNADSNGIQSQHAPCEKDECNVPVPGHWGRWAPWSACSTTTGHGYRTRSRECDNPKPQNEGDYCEGTLVQTCNC